jgi:Flp pilus assembly pilin Flp
VDRLMRIFRNRRGQDTIEYALLAAFISVVALSAMMYIGPWVKPVYYEVQDAVRRAVRAGLPGNPGGGDPGGRTPGQ